MSALDAILAEEWTSDGDRLELVSHEARHARGPEEARAGVVVGVLARFGTPITLLREAPPNGSGAAELVDDDTMRVEVAVLGKRALALILKQSGPAQDASINNECAAEWAAIVAEAKRLREGT